MTTFQKVIKYLAIAFAVFLTVSIIGSIISAVGLFGGSLVYDNVEDELSDYTVSSDIKELKVDIRAADFSIISSNSFLAKSNLKNLKIEEKDGVLTITEKRKFSLNYKNAVLKLYIPKDFVFEKADIFTGAGKLTVDTLSADSLHLELGAGAVKIGQLNATKKAEIDGGTGQVTVSGGSLYNLDLDMGVGKLDLTSAILGNSVLDYGVGEANLTLIGSKKDYKIELDKGIGSATIDGENMSDDSVYSNGINKIDIDGGVGAVKVNFKEK